MSVGHALRYNETSYRVCFHCVHSSGNGERCGHAEVAGRGETVPVVDARALNRPCGPEARYLLIRGE